MSNISFANPYLLFLLIPLLLICFIPFFIAVRKDNRTINHILSLIMHVVMSILVVLVMAGFTYELVVTETDIYVLADVSYSSHNNLEKIDDYIMDLDKNAPKNSKIGVIAFAKDYELLNEPGEKIRSVYEASVDDSATNINDALTYAGTLFKNNVIKRIVIISDGKETNKSNIVSVVESLQENDIYIDAIYLDNNLKEGTNEIQISQIDFNPSTFINKKESIDVMVDSSLESTQGVIELIGPSGIYEATCKLSRGLNVVSIPLDTSKSGSFDYKVRLAGFKKGDDTSEYNNSYSFTQSVSESVNVLFIGDKAPVDRQALDRLYRDDMSGTKYNITEYLGRRDVPYTVMELCKYDEIVLSNIDVRDLENSNQFIKSLDTVVSKYGKKLLTVGNTYIQKQDGGILDDYSKMLPVSYGNNDKDEKVLALVLDISRSLSYDDRGNIAKKAACATLDLLKENDMVVLIGFYGDVEVIQPLTNTDDIQSIKDKINKITLGQGTYVGTALQAAFDTIRGLPYSKKEVMLISDGLPHSSQEEIAYDVADQMRKKHIPISTINCNCPKGEELLAELATRTGGNYYFAESLDTIEDLVLTDIADDIKDTVVENGSFSLRLHNNNELLNGIDTIPNISGFYYNEAKNHTKVLLTTKYTSRGGVEYDVPILTTWGYGNGEVVSLATRIDKAKNWTKSWASGTSGEMLLDKLKGYLIPEARLASPFTFEVSFDGSYANIKIGTPSINPEDRVTLELIDPDGNRSSCNLLFNSVDYIAKIEIEKMGKYGLELSYTNGDLAYSASNEFNISYSPEYNAFESFEASSLYHMVTENGQVSEDGKLKLVNDSDYVESYLFDFTIVFMIICCVLFVADICVRKLRLEDIKSFFRMKRSRR